MNIVCITTGSRPELLKQTLLSLKENAADWDSHHLTVVFDDPAACYGLGVPYDPNSQIVLTPRVNASAARNIGASSIPKYRRQESVCFFDDDVYAVPGWDTKLEELLKAFPNVIATGHAHPYNGSELMHLSDGAAFGDVKVYNASKALGYRAPLVISSVNMAMSWERFDGVGWFLEPGGAGGSEDWNYCDRAVKMGTKLAITEPEVVLHTGQHSSNGKEIIGYAEVCANNQRLLDIHGLTGKVIFS